jgi:hypothetical protein
MASAITETDTYTATITAPDAGDALTAASVRTMGQGLTNRSLHHENRIDDLETAMTAVEAVADAAKDAVVGQFQPVASALVNGGVVTLSGVVRSWGGTFSTASNAITVPSAGVYRAKANIRVTTTGVSDPSYSVLTLKVGGTIMTWISGVRFNADAGDDFFIYGETIFAVGTPALDVITLENVGGTMSIESSDEEAVLIIERIGST